MVVAIPPAGRFGSYRCPGVWLVEADLGIDGARGQHPPGFDSKPTGVSIHLDNSIGSTSHTPRQAGTSTDPNPWV